MPPTGAGPRLVSVCKGPSAVRRVAVAGGILLLLSMHLRVFPRRSPPLLPRAFMYTLVMNEARVALLSCRPVMNTRMDELYYRM